MDPLLRLRALKERLKEPKNVVQLKPTPFLQVRISQLLGIRGMDFNQFNRLVGLLNEFFRKENIR